MAHEIPDTLDTWLAGWRPSKSGNPYRRLGDDVYVVFPSRRGGWTASVGRTFVNRSWADAEMAKAGLYDLVIEAAPDRLAAMHRGEVDAEPARPDRSDGDGAEVLARFPRQDQEVRLERREYEGKPFLALVKYRFGPDGPRAEKLVSIRFSEAPRLADAIKAAIPPARPAVPAPADDHTPRYVDRGRPQRPPWDRRNLPAAAAAGTGERFDEFGD